MAKFGRFGILADGQPIRLDHAFDVLLAPIEASGRWAARTSSLSCGRQSGTAVQIQQSG
jgi:hypothetical protein